LLVAIFNQLLKALLLGILLASSCFVYAEVEFLVFPEIKIQHQNSETFSEKNITPSLDIFTAGNIGFVNILAEGFVSEKIQHIERLQFGVNITDNARIWLGRHHTPYGYWHTQYHHGNFLQTSISRPSISELGGAGGIVPSHSTGILLEGEVEQQTSAWHYMASIGLTSLLDSSGGGHHGGSSAASLSDFDIFNPKPSDHELGYAFRLTYFPDALGETQIGGFINREDIILAPTEQHLTDETHDEEHSTNDKIISLNIFGVFVNYQHQAIRLISEAYYLSSKVPSDTQMEKGSFSAAYLQVEYTYDENWLPYVRVDRSFSDSDDPYLHLLDGYPVSANTVGIRVDLPRNNAIKFEYSKRDYNHESTELWLLNWSAVW